MTATLENRCSLPSTVVRAARPSTVRIALLGVGTVGSAFLDRLVATGLPVELAYVGNSRHRLIGADGRTAAEVLDRLAASTEVADLGAVGPSLGDPAGCRVVVDATASAAVAARHAHWLVRGIHVVTASKIANGGGQTDADALVSAAVAGGARYGASATVGAGLPLLRTIHELRAGGDEIHRISGVLSGSLAWLFDAYGRAGGSRPFSQLVEEARRLGFTEPDPRVDLAGADVQRKLLILARAAGARLGPSDIAVTPVGPVERVPAAGQRAEAAAETEWGAPQDDSRALDEWVAERFGGRDGSDHRLQYVATWSRGERPTAGLQQLGPDDPLASGSGTDNRVAIWSTRYAEKPLIIQGPGAGAGVTAAALLDDVLRARAG